MVIAVIRRKLLQTEHIDRVDGTIIEPDIFQKTMQMFHANMMTSLLASHVASKSLQTDGLLVLVGSSFCMSPAPATLAYGISKNSVHYLVGGFYVKALNLNYLLLLFLTFFYEDAVDGKRIRSFQGGMHPSWDIGYASESCGHANGGSFDLVAAWCCFKAITVVGWIPARYPSWWPVLCHRWTSETIPRPELNSQISQKFKTAAVNFDQRSRLSFRLDIRA